MLGDPTQRWEPFPTPMDGIRYPHVWVAGWHGDLFAHVQGESRHYGVRFPSTRAWAGVSESHYSMGTGNHDGGTYEGARGEGGIYLKKALASAFLASVQHAESVVDEPLNAFLLVGSDCCYEVICACEPVILELDDFDAARQWATTHASGAGEYVD